MPRTATIFDILIASPSDVQDARDVAAEVIQDWNAANSRAAEVMLHSVRWETHVHPQLGDRPQAIVNEQIVDDADILLGIFWTRLGTKTGVAKSGTVEEIERLREKDKPVLLYFSEQPVVMKSIDMEQYAQLDEYRKGLRDKGLYEAYHENEELRRKLSRHLALVMHKLAPKSQTTPIPIAVPIAPGTQRANIARGQRGEILRLQAIWEAERDSDLPKHENGQNLLSRLADLLARAIAIPLIHDDETIAARLRELLTRTKNAEYSQIYLDGGVSWRAFWQDGTNVLSETELIFREMGQIS